MYPKLISVAFLKDRPSLQTLDWRRIPDLFTAACSDTFAPVSPAMFGQKAEQRAKCISFHALPPRAQMFTWKTSPLIQAVA